MNQFIVELLNLLNKKKIKYVHWKSNLNIEKALNAEDDLDLLVDKKFSSEIDVVFRQMKIIRAYSEKDKWQNEIFHFIGCDCLGNKLIHIHLHYSLEVGFDFDKKYTLPIVKKYIEKSILYKNIVFLPQVEKEYIVLVIRLIIKHSFFSFIFKSPWLQLFELFQYRKEIINGNAYEEFLDLNKKRDLAIVRDILEKEFTFISFNIFLQLENVLIKNDTIFEYFKAGIILKKRLKGFSNHNNFISFVKIVPRVAKVKFNILKSKFINTTKRSSKIPENGGKIIAFIGGDGAGKTTNIINLYGILSRHFNTHIIHLGRPKITLVSFIIYIFQKLLTAIKLKNYSLSLYYIRIAKERVASYKKAIKLQKKGSIILFDRLPLDGIDTMDCPKISTINNKNIWFSWLSNYEKKLYKQIGNVDLLIVLKLDPVIALIRRPEDDKRLLTLRSENIWKINWYERANLEVAEIDASQPLQVVEEKVLLQVWKRLIRKNKRAEIIGLPGSGKTSLVSLLSKETKLVSSINFFTYPFETIHTILFGIPSILNILLEKKEYNNVLNYVFFNILYRVMQKQLKNNNLIFNNYIFDQGPLFMLALGLKEGLWDKDFVNKKIDLVIGNFITTVYYLHAPYDVLYKRVISREQAHRVKKSGLTGFKEFCNSYEELFAFVLNNRKFRVIHVDTFLKDDLQKIKTMILRD